MSFPYSTIRIVEHIEPGRYSATLDLFGTKKVIEELKRVLAPRGHLWLSLTISDQYVVYLNVGRILERNYFLV